MAPPVTYQEELWDDVEAKGYEGPVSLESSPERLDLLWRRSDDANGEAMGVEHAGPPVGVP